MDPFTMALLAAGTGANILGKLSAGASSKAMSAISSQIYGTNAEIANSNADTLDMQADVADMGVDFSWSKAKTQISRIEEQGRQVLSTQRSYFAGNNLDPTFGSPLLMQAITAGRVQSDVELTKAGAAIEAADARTRAANIRAQAAGQRGNALTQLYQQAGAQMKGDADMTAGYFGAATALLSGVTQFAGGGGFGGGGTASTIQVGSQTFPSYSA